VQNLIQAILSACPRVTVLATSREVLAVSGEVVAPVPPLPLPADKPFVSLAEVGAFEAPRLFIERAVSCFPGLTFADSDAIAVGTLLPAPASRWDAAGHRASCCAHARPFGPSDRGAPSRVFRLAGIRQPQRAAQTTLAARRYRTGASICLAQRSRRCYAAWPSSPAPSRLKRSRHLRRRGESGSNPRPPSSLVDKSLATVRSGEGRRYACSTPSSSTLGRSWSSSSEKDATYRTLPRFLLGLVSLTSGKQATSQETCMRPPDDSSIPIAKTCCARSPGVGTLLESKQAYSLSPACGLLSRAGESARTDLLD